MKKVKMTMQSAKRVKSIIAAAMTFALAVPATACFTPKSAKAAAEVSVPKAAATVSFEKGFIGEQKENGLAVVRSEDVLVMWEELDDQNKYIWDVDKKSYIYRLTDKPFDDEGNYYKYNVQGNQPVTAYDEEKGNVLTLDDTVYRPEVRKTESDRFDAFVLNGTILQYETTVQSQLQVTNPFAGKMLDGASVSYWVKVPKGADGNKVQSSLIVFGVKENVTKNDVGALFCKKTNGTATMESQLKDIATIRANKEAAIEKDSKLSVQISTGNDFHYVNKDQNVTAAYVGADKNADVIQPETWAYVTVSMTDSQIVTYVDGQQVSAVDVTAAGLLNTLADSNTGAYIGGNYSMAAEEVGQNYGTVNGVLLDDISYYTKAVTKDEAAKLYDNAKVSLNKRADEDWPEILEYFDFENGMTGKNGTTIETVDSYDDAEVVEDNEILGHVLRIGMGTATDANGVKLSRNPFAGRDMQSASISYWVRETKPARGTPGPSIALSFIDEPKMRNHDKIMDANKRTPSQSVLYTKTDLDAVYEEGYTTLAYQNLKNHFRFSITRNDHTRDINAMGQPNKEYDEIAVACQADYVAKLEAAVQWHMITVTVSNAGIKMYYDGRLLTNNLAETNGTPAYYGPRFYDGYYSMLYDGFGSKPNPTSDTPAYMAANNQLATPLMTFLTQNDTSAYLAYMYKAGTEKITDGMIYERTYETFFDHITYYAGALTDEQVRGVYYKGVVPASSKTEEQIINEDGTVTNKVTEKVRESDGTETETVTETTTGLDGIVTEKITETTMNPDETTKTTRKETVTKPDGSAIVKTVTDTSKRDATGTIVTDSSVTDEIKDVSGISVGKYEYNADVLPSDVEWKTDVVENLDKTSQEAIEQSGAKDYVAYDIKPQSQGKDAELKDGKVKVSLFCGDKWKGKKVKVFDFETKQWLDATQEGGYVSFYAERFGRYAIAGFTRYAQGDVHGDGDGVNLKDAQFILKVALRIVKENTLSEAQLEAADVVGNKDGINLKDAQAVLKRALRIPVTFDGE